MLLIAEDRSHPVSMVWVDSNHMRRTYRTDRVHRICPTPVYSIDIDSEWDYNHLSPTGLVLGFRLERVQHLPQETLQPTYSPLITKSIRLVVTHLRLSKTIIYWPLTDLRSAKLPQKRKTFYTLPRPNLQTSSHTITHLPDLMFCSSCVLGLHIRASLSWTQCIPQTFPSSRSPGMATDANPTRQQHKRHDLVMRYLT
jgi:hypothetical protein